MTLRLTARTTVSGSLLYADKWATEAIISRLCNTKQLIGWRRILRKTRHARRRLGLQRAEISAKPRPPIVRARRHAAYRFGVIAAYSSNFAPTRSLWLKISGTRGRLPPIIFARIVRPMNALHLCPRQFSHRCYGWGTTSENRAKTDDFAPTRSMDAGPLLFEILGQPTPVGAKSPIFNRYSPVAPQP